MSRVHHDDEGRIFLRDAEGLVWRMTIRAEAAPESRDGGRAAPATLHRIVEFRAPSGRTVSIPFEGEAAADDFTDEQIQALFRRAQGRRGA